MTKAEMGKRIARLEAQLSAARGNERAFYVKVTGLEAELKDCKSRLDLLKRSMERAHAMLTMLMVLERESGSMVDRSQEIPGIKVGPAPAKLTERGKMLECIRGQVAI